jgi:hypothetical protein
MNYNESSRGTLIVRQSQMERAIEYYKLIGIEPTVIELLATADHFSQYIEQGMTKEIIEKSKRVDEFIDKKKHVKELQKMTL